jgi:hypothetical protein
MIGVAQSAMAVAEIVIDALIAHLVIGIVGVCDREFLQDSELGFDEVQPGGLGWGPCRVNVQFLQEGLELRVIVNIVEVIENDMQAFPRIAFPQFAECGSIAKCRLPSGRVEVPANHVV